MKKIVQWVLVCSVLCITITHSVYAQSNKEAWNSAYRLSYEHLIGNDLIVLGDFTINMADLNFDGSPELIVYPSANGILYCVNPYIFVIDENGESRLAYKGGFMQLDEIKLVRNKITDEQKYIITSNFADGYCSLDIEIAAIKKDKNDIVFESLFRETCDHEAEEKNREYMDEDEWSHVSVYTVNGEKVGQEVYEKMLDEFWENFEIIEDLKLVSSEEVFHYREKDKIKVTLNEKIIVFDNPTVIIDDRTLVPMRAIFESLGADVYWVEKGETIVAVKNDLKIIMAIGNNRMLVTQISQDAVVDADSLYLDSKTASLDVPPQIIGDRTFVPVRAISEAFGVEVQWDEAESTVVLTDKRKTMLDINFDKVFFEKFIAFSLEFSL